MKIINYIKQLLVMMVIVTGMTHAAPASFCSLAKNSITPEGFREVGEVININFALENTSTTPCPATDGVGVANMRINIALDKLVPDLVGGVPNVTGDILTYFDVTYDAIDNELDLVQTADVPPNTDRKSVV